MMDIYTPRIMQDFHEATAAERKSRFYSAVEHQRWLLRQSGRRVVMFSDFMACVEPAEDSRSGHTIRHDIWMKRHQLAAAILNEIAHGRAQLYILPMYKIPPHVDLFDLREIWKHEDQDKKIPWGNGGADVIHICNQDEGKPVGDPDIENNYSLARRLIRGDRFIPAKPCFLLSDLMNAAGRAINAPKLRVPQWIASRINAKQRCVAFVDLFKGLLELPDYSKLAEGPTSAHAERGPAPAA